MCQAPNANIRGAMVKVTFTALQDVLYYYLVLTKLSHFVHEPCSKSWL